MSQYGSLTVVGNTGRKTHRGSDIVTCKCVCGNVKEYSIARLSTGHTTSCGCLIHTPTYQTWAGMKYRCNGRRCHAFKDYGGRGITVCERWNSFTAFLEDMGERPEGMTLDRISVDGNYEPRNCRWATPTAQGRNRRSNKLTATIVETIRSSGSSNKELAEMFGVDASTISRVRRGTRWDTTKEITHANTGV